MRATIDIENSKSKEMETLNVPVIEYEENKKVLIDISSITEHELFILSEAINPELTHTDIEMFFLDVENDLPHFGPDFDFSIKENTLCGYYVRDKWLSERREINGK